eukprot:8970060-Lingulodinium_polyedra.AAC.1
MPRGPTLLRPLPFRPRGYDYRFVRGRAQGCGVGWGRWQEGELALRARGQGRLVQPPSKAEAPKGSERLPLRARS